MTNKQKPELSTSSQERRALAQYERRLYAEWRKVNDWWKSGHHEPQPPMPLLTELIHLALADYRMRKRVNLEMEFMHSIGPGCYRQQRYCSTNLGRVLLIAPEHKRLCKVASGFGMS